MSEITLINWLKAFPFLSEKVNSSNLEEIFSNGFYFGKIFQTHNIFQEMKFLKDSNEKKDIFNNYIFLKKPFRKIGIDLIEQDINDLITKKLHKAELYLFKIKQYLLLDKIQFKEIVEKMDAEIHSKLKEEIDFKNQQKNLLNRFQSAKRRSQPIIPEKKQNRLQSAKLPNIQYNPKKIKNLNNNKIISNNNKDIFAEENEKANIKQMQAVINDIKIFENIHMNKVGLNSNKLNPWDEISFIYEKKDLLDKEKSKELKNKLFNILNKENKKENENIKNKKSEDKLEKIKSTLNNYNQFMVDHKKKFLKKEDLEKGLSLMGLNATYMFPSILKIRENKIPSELVMKSVNDKNKETNKIKSATFYKEKKIAKEKIDAPISARGHYADLKLKNKIINEKDKVKENKLKASRAQTAKIPKQKLNNKKLSLKKNDKNINNLNILDKSQKQKEQKEEKKEPIETKKTKKEKKNLLAKIEENEKVSYQNSLPSSVISYVRTEEDEILKKENINPKKDEKKILTDEERLKLHEKKKKQFIIDTKNIKNIISSLIDITEIYFEYQNNTGEEFIDLERWNKISYDFIHNKNIIKHHKAKKIKIKEEKDNTSSNNNTQISNEKLSKNLEDKNEMKNYLYNIGIKYDINKNNLYIKKLGIKSANLEINDIMGDEIQLLFNKMLAEGKILEDDENDEETKKNGKIKYRPNREEEQLLEINYKSTTTEYQFTNLISEIIKFVYDKEKEKEKEKNKELKENEINENNNDISLKDILISIPIKMSFIGLMNSEIKLIIKNSINKYPKMKLYNPIEFFNELRTKKKKIDEPIDEQNLRKYQVEQLKKEKNILTEEIKDFLDLLENENNLSDDEICVKILQILIRKDFEKKNLENIKQEITTKRENINNLNDKINALKEEQNKGKKVNPRDIDNLQQQIDKIYFDSMIGFIIINFPNNPEQSKLMEKYFMDLVQPCEQGISDFDLINDNLLFICDKETKNQKCVKFEPSLEKFVLFYCDNNKLIKQENQEKQNQNQNQENAVPEFNKDLIDSYYNNFKEMEEFYQNFNIKIDKYDYYEGIEEENNIFLNNNNINMNSNGFIQRDKIIYEKLKSSLTLYEEKLVPLKINNIILADESYDEVLEEVIQIKEKDSSRIMSGDSSIKQMTNNSKPQLKSNPKKDTDNLSTLKNNEITSQKNYKAKPKIISLTQLSEEETYNIYKIWKDFVEQYNYHINKILYNDKNSKSKKIEEELIEIQKDYINFLVEPEKQNILVKQFIDKYKCFRDKFIKDKRTNKESNKIIIDNFQKDLVELNEAMWSVAKIKKNQAFIEIDKIENENIISKDLNLCYNKLESLIILESEKLIVTINIFVRYFTFIFNPKYISNNNNVIPQFKLDTNLSDEILKDLENEDLAKELNEKRIIYPRANRLFKNTFRLLIKIYLFLDNFYNKVSIKDKKGNITSSVNKSIKSKKTKPKLGGINTQNSISSIGQFNPNSKLDMQNQIKIAINVHIKKYKNRIYNLYMNALEDLSKIFCPFRQIIKLMDDWIILSMELQTNNINKAIKELDVTNNYKINSNESINSQEEKIEKNIVDLIIAEKSQIYSYEFTGINPNDFTLFDQNKFLGISEINKERNINTDDDYYKIFEYIKDYDIILKLRNAEIQKGIITKDKFEEIFFKFGFFEHIDKFPKSFKDLDYHNISKFLSHFAFLSSDFNKNKNDVDNIHPQKLLYTNDIITILIISCVVFDKEKIKQKYNMIETNYINEENFMKNDFGFDNELINIKNRNNLKREIKSMLFNINKTCNDIPEINIKKFLELILLKPLKNIKNEIVVKKCFDLFYN